MPQSKASEKHNPQSEKQCRVFNRWGRVKVATRPSTDCASAKHADIDRANRQRVVRFKEKDTTKTAFWQLILQLTAEKAL